MVVYQATFPTLAFVPKHWSHLRTRLPSPASLAWAVANTAWKLQTSSSGEAAGPCCAEDHCRSFGGRWRAPTEGPDALVVVQGTVQEATSGTFWGYIGSYGFVEAQDLGPCLQQDLISKHRIGHLVRRGHVRKTEAEEHHYK